MNMPMCSRCGKNVAVVFITKIDQNNNSTQEGLCLKCAKEMGLKPIDNLMEQMGITDADLEALSSEISAFGDLSGLVPAGNDGEDLDAPHNQDEEPEEDEGNDDSAMPLPFQIFRQERPKKEEQKNEKKAGRRDKKRKFLTSYCEDLTGKARSGRIDRIVGRERETERVIQILNRRQKNNPCLIGEPGVGKTAVAEGLALRIAEGKVPYKLRDKEIHLLDLTALVAGTQFRGQFESRMKGLIDEVKKLGNIILVIDEVHNIVGAGDSEGSMNAANILKPALSRGEIQVIGATTFNEYRKYIEKDSALERRFQPVSVEEPSLEDAAEILMGVKNYYEDFHFVTIPDAMCRQAVQLAERYITDRFLPDKAIDLIDEACSDLNLKNEMLSIAADCKQELKLVTGEREELMSADAPESEPLTSEQLDERYARIAELRSRELQLENRLHEAESAPRPVLTLDNLASVIELWTNIPASKVQAQEMQRLTGMEERLQKRVVGQDEAIHAIADAIRRSRAGISPKKKPVSFLFVGPTGVGKTELVKTLAEDLFDTPEALIRLDMSEYMEKHTVARLIGSPPGYVGYDEAGQLTEKIRRRPYSVILMDEIEKAHPDVLNILLQILDDGRLTDAHGRVVNFENTVIIMTSNAGSGSKTTSLGFGKTASEQGREKAMKALEELMRPEFLNRIDEIVAFNQLTEADFSRIAGILLGDLAKNLAERDIRLTWDDSLTKYLVEKSYSLKFGARNLRRLIEKEVENALAARMIASYEQPIVGAHVTAENGALKVETI
ncbi:MAG: ATP-dependent Clp protease ATP-binding subunit [Clostridiaceae bacterium]|nr:ATP-dependent Clp protease ATP-binding subunit [Clostridiaceae bacterium]